ncbi:TRAP transporter substrate-binding protein DctP [Tistrella sp. BH-R2-4]|uniref:TRAP transporter substrate-binding protein DctP n=1 Tax=Tistrella arctica TaxID=3133430 RepID=A0ABU9YP30_9PROT
MHRRDVLKGALAATAAGGALAAPAIARAQTKVRWRMPSSFPQVLDTVYGAGAFIAERVATMTDGQFEITPYAAGEIVPPLGILDGVQAGTVECGITAGFYYLGKMPALVFDTGVPFGMTPRQHMAWMQYGGGYDLMAELYGQFNAVQFPCGNTGAQMGGWFRKPIESVDDLKGLRIRAAGYLGQIYAALGAVPQQIPGSDLYSALERGTLDAVEFVGPYDDEKLGFQKVAKYYYGPGVLELGASLCFLANSQAFAALPTTFQQILKSACAESYTDMLAKYDQRNIGALRRLVASGVQLKSWTPEIMTAMQTATARLLADQSATDETFGRVHTAWKAFLDEQLLWGSVNDFAAESFIVANRGR